MIRVVAWSLAVLLTAQAAPAVAQSVNVAGKMSKFIISNGVTGPGTLTLSGNIAGTSYPVTLTATVPNGPMTFTYVINGNSYTLAGIGKVTVK
jgi:hypothetical protein